MRNYLTFDNKDSRDFGVYINGQGTFRAPARSYNVLNIPGRNGDLLGFGSKLENVEITYRAFIYTNFDANIAALRSFLLSHVGYFKLTDSYHPDEYRLAYYKGPFVPDVVANNGAGSFDLTFVCKPQRFLNSGEEVTTLTPAGAEQHTYQGEIVNFSTLAGDKITSARADFHPIQDLHGYSSPWPAGGGKNLLDTSSFTSGTYNTVTLTRNSDGTISLNGTASATININGSNFTLPAGTYTLSGSIANNQLYLYDANANTPLVESVGGSIRNCTISETKTVYLRLRVGGGSSVSGTVKPQLESGSTATSFAPYSNICPISGRTGVSVYRTGKNMCYHDPNVNSNIYNGGNLIPVKAGDKVYCYGEWTYTQSANLWGGIFASQSETNKNNRKVQFDGFTSGGVMEYTITEDGYFGVAYNAGFYTYTIEKMMISLSPITGATDYEPYQGNIYSVDWTSTAGTVYGGTLDVVTGVLTVDRAYALLNDPSQWAASSGTVNFIYNTSYSDRKKYNNSYGGIICSYMVVSSAGQNTITARWTGATSNFFGLRWVGGTLDQVKADAQENKIAIVYELATPLTYQLTAQEVEALADNYMWSDVGQVTVTVTDAMTIENPTLFDAKPLLRVYGAGTLTLGGQTITISTADVYTDIDCEMMDCFKDTVSKNGNVSFSGYDFPVIPPGRNVITMDGVTQVDITPRWWAA